MRFTFILQFALASAWQIILDPEVLKPVVSTTSTTSTETVNILEAPEPVTSTYWSSKSKDCQTVEESVAILSAPSTTTYTIVPYTTETTTTTEEPVVILSAPSTTTYTTIPYSVIYTASTETTVETTVETTTTTEEPVVILSAPSTTTTETYTTIAYTTIPYSVIYTTTTETTTTTEEPVVILSAPSTTTAYTTIPYSVIYTSTTTEEPVIILSASSKDIDPEMYYTYSKKVKTLAATTSVCPESEATTTIVITTTATILATCESSTVATATATATATTCPEPITVTVSATLAPTQTTESNFCDDFPGLELANGTQNRAGSCNLAILGAIPSVEKLVSTLVLEPVDGTIFLVGEDVIIRIKSLNMDFGNFDDPNSEYYTGPQSLSAEGVILGHTHVTVEKIVDADVFPNPASPVFFRGFDAEPIDGELSTTILGSLLVESGPGVYRLCTITTNQSHRPVLMPIARRGAVDDCIRFTIL